MKKLALLFLAACQSGDPCAGHVGNDVCLGLVVTGASGVGQIDELDEQVIAGGRTLVGATRGAPANLPARSALYLPAGTTGAAHLDVIGRLGGVFAGAGSADFPIVPGATETLTLAPAVAFDLSGDGPLPFDFSIPLDFAMPRDFATATGDLGNYYVCPLWSLFCDQFDRPAPWMIWTSNSSGGTSSNTLTDDSLNAWSGSVIHMTTSSPNNVVYLTENVVASSGVLSVRFYSYVRTMPASGLEIMDLQMMQADTLGAKVTFSGTAGTAVWGLGNQSSVTASSVTATTNAWWCNELVVDYSANQITLYAAPAGTGHLPSAAAQISAAPATVAMFSLGVLGASPSPVDISFDDVAVANQRIGCE